MRYFYDTEFLEDGFSVDLISIGIHADDGREFYAVSNEFDTRRVLNNWWLMRNVMSSIDHQIILDANMITGMPFRNMAITDEWAKSRAEIAAGILEFIEGDPNPEFWAWYSAYDHVALMQLFGPMITKPEQLPMYTMDIKQEQQRLRVPMEDMPKQPAGKHNALEDAKMNKVRLQYLERRELDDAIETIKKYGPRFLNSQANSNEQV